MTEQTGEPSIEPNFSKGNSIVSVTLFKILTRREMARNRLRVGRSELQHLSQSNLVIEIPPRTDLSKTLFDFCLPFTVLEFKSQNEQFNLEEFVVNQTRTDMVFLQRLDRTEARQKKGRLANIGKDARPGSKTLETDNKFGKMDANKYYTQFLNLYVLATYPTEFLELAAGNGMLFEIDETRPWLRWSKVDFHTPLGRVAIVVLADLPIEKRFYSWLLFALSEGEKWGAFVRQLQLEGDKELLELACKLRPKDFVRIRMNIEALDNNPEMKP